MEKLSVGSPYAEKKEEDWNRRESGIGLKRKEEIGALVKSGNSPS